MSVLARTSAPIAAAFAALAFCGSAGAATITTDPGSDATVLGDGICTLREAVNAANNNAGSVDCEPGFGADVIMLPAGTYPLTGFALEDANANGDIDVLSDITFVGAGAGSTIIDAGHNDRAIDVMSGRTVSMSGLTITNGHAPDGTGGSMGTSPVAGGSGGGIRNAGALTLDGVTITQNSAGNGGSSATNSSGGGPGGGIWSSPAGGTLTIRDSVIQGNHAGTGANGGGGNNSSVGGSPGAGGSGGGIFTGAATITDSTITGNAAGNGGIGGVGTTTPDSGENGGAGGGIYGTTLTLTRTSVTDNDAGNGGTTGTDPDGSNTALSGNGGAGGGIIAETSLTLTDSTVTGNHAGNGGVGGPGTGFFPNTGTGGNGGDGGGVLAPDGSSISGSTLAGNSAGSGGGSSDGTAGWPGDGGGLFVSNGATATITTSVVNGNTTGHGGDSFNGTPRAGGRGGGILIDNNATLTITNVTITGNTTGTGGQAGFGPGSPGGAGAGIGLDAFAGANVTHVTLAANTTGAGGGGNPNGAQGEGGGIYSVNGFTGVQNSIVASNAPENCSLNAPGDVNDNGRNVLFGNGGTPCPLGTAVQTDPLLGALADNGGRTKTMALGDGSPAIDLVPVQTNCTPTDQRGVSRPQFAACDAGAFELAPPPPPPTTGGDNQQPPSADNTQNQPPPAANGAVPDKTPPAVKLLLTKQKLLKALKKGYFALFTDDEPGAASADLFASGKDAKGAATKRKRVAHGTLKVTKTGKQKLVVRFTKKAKKAFKKRKKKVTLALVLKVKDAAGNATTKTAKVTLKR